uniref:SWIM-type domain-containing protein n=1 Tax=Setaria italica TaxID=4555 RepID=K3ZCA9_SETIT
MHSSGGCRHAGAVRQAGPLGADVGRRLPRQPAWRDSSPPIDACWVRPSFLLSSSFSSRTSRAQAPPRRQPPSHPQIPQIRRFGLGKVVEIHPYVVWKFLWKYVQYVECVQLICPICAMCSVHDMVKYLYFVDGSFSSLFYSVEFFDGPPTFTDLVDRAMRKYRCRVDEMTLRGCFDCGKARAHYVLMNLGSDSNWKHYKDVVHEANVACLEVVVEIVRMLGPNVVLRDEVVVVNRNGTQESEILQHVLGETESAFDLAIANDDFPNDTFERDEANIDDDDISMGSEDSEFEDDGVVERDVELPSVPNDRDISMVHKAICESSMVNFEGIPFSESLVIKYGMKFKSLEELKFFLADYAVRLHRPFSVVRSDKNLRYNVMCKQGCHWRVWSRLISSTGQWRILNVVQSHTCRSSQLKRVHVQCIAKYLGRRILGIIRKDNETSVPSLVESIFAFSGYRVKYSKVCLAKQHAIALLWGDSKESYGMVPRVLTAMAYYNFGVKWFIDSCDMMHPDNGVLKHVLQRVFWCFPQCSVAFQHCRPMILVDDTFLTGKYKGTLLMAVGVDPKQQLVPLAFALAESENNESWSWFMKLVRRHVLGPSCQVYMISDRHHGLLNYVNDHGWHFAANMSCRQKNDRVIGKLKTLCKLHTETEFNEKLEHLVKDLNDDAKEWLKGEKEDKDKWAQAFDEGGMRWGIMTTNYSESLNVVFKGIRSRPVSRIIEYSIEKCNAYFVDMMAKDIHGDRHYRVDLNEVSCTCNVSQLLHLPCSHFITACKARGLNYESPLYMSPLYSREHTVRIWESSFQPYLDPSQWPPYEGVEYVPNPNLMRNKVGRRQKKRLRGDMDVMAAPAYPLLEATYDSEHRAHPLTDLHECPKTHTFHLPFGEMTITMQDIAMILDLPLEGHPVMGIIQSKNWRDMVAMHIGIKPPELEDGDNSKKTSAMASKQCSSHILSCVDVQAIRGNPYRRYRAYTNELDVVTQHQVEWEPDRQLCRCTTPMILYYVVEFHMLHRVMWQFGRMQTCPPLELSTSQQLHRLKHAQYLIQWENRQRCDPEGGPYWRAGPNNEFIRWYCASTRTKAKPSWSNVPIEDAPYDSSDDIADVYDTVTRYGTQPERALLHDYMQLARLANEVGVVMERAVGSSDGVLRQFAEVEAQPSLHRCPYYLCNPLNIIMVNLCCLHVVEGSKKLRANGHEDELHVSHRYAPRGQWPGHFFRITADSIGDSPKDCITIHCAGNQPEDDNPTYGEELEMSSMFDAPPVTQTQGESS